MNRTAPVWSLVLAPALAACGGGGGGGGGAPGTPTGPFVAGVAYLADAEVDEKVELYVAALDGSEVRRVSLPGGPASDVVSFAWSPDRARLVYVLEEDGAGTGDSVWTVPAAGGPSARVSPPLPGGQQIDGVRWAPNSTRVAWSSIDASGTGEAWTALPDGSGAVRVSGPTVAGVSASELTWSPGSNRLLQVRRAVGSSEPGLVLTDPDGGGFVDLGSGGSYAWAPNGARLAHVHFTNYAAGVYEVRVTPAAGTPGTVVEGPVAGAFPPFGFAWAPDSSRTAYFGAGDFDFTFRLSMWSDVGGRIPLDDLALASVGLLWSPDSAHLAFGDVTEPLEVDPEAPSRLLAADAAGTVTPMAGQASVLRAWLDDRRVLVEAPYAPDSAVMTAELQGTDTTLLLAGASGAVVSPDGTAFAAFSSAPQGIPEVFVGSTDSTYGAHRASVPLYAPLRVAVPVRWTPDSTRLVYVATPRGVDVLELFASTADGFAHVRLSGPLVDGGQVTTFEVR